MSYYVDTVADDLRTWFEDDEPLTAQEVYDMTCAATNPAPLSSWISDTAYLFVTGADCGSYTCDRAKARDLVLEHMDEVTEAHKEFGALDSFANDIAANDWEALDVTARCYALYEASDIVANEIVDAINDNYDELVTRGEIEPDAADAC